MLLLAGGEGHVPQPGIEGRDVLQPGRLGAQQFGGRPALAGDGAGYLQDPPRRDPLDVAAQVAARHTEHMSCRAGQGGEKLAVLALDAAGTAAAARSPAVSRS